MGDRVLIFLDRTKRPIIVTGQSTKDVHRGFMEALASRTWLNIAPDDRSVAINPEHVRQVRDG